MYQELAEKIIFTIRQHSRLFPMHDIQEEIVNLLKKYFPEKEVEKKENNGG